jgi:hypothetical protein
MESETLQLIDRSKGRDQGSGRRPIARCTRKPHQTRSRTSDPVSHNTARRYDPLATPEDSAHYRSTIPIQQSETGQSTRAKAAFEASTRRRRSCRKSCRQENMILPSSLKLIFHDDRPISLSGKAEPERVTFEKTSELVKISLRYLETNRRFAVKELVAQIDSGGS